MAIGADEKGRGRKEAWRENVEKAEKAMRGGESEQNWNGCRKEKETKKNGLGSGRDGGWERVVGWSWELGDGDWVNLRGIRLVDKLVGWVGGLE